MEKNKDIYQPVIFFGRFLKEIYGEGKTVPTPILSQEMWLTFCFWTQQFSQRQIGEAFEELILFPNLKKIIVNVRWYYFAKCKF